MTDRTGDAVRKTLAALAAPSYLIGVLDQSRMHLVEMPLEEVMRKLPYLKARNARGAHIYFAPANSTRYTLLDDLTVDTLRRMTTDGFEPCATVETSYGNFQAWLRHSAEFQQEHASLAARLLSQRYDADRSAAGWRRLGRLPGFTNRKDKYRDECGRFPFVLLRTSSGRSFTRAEQFRHEVKSRQAADECKPQPSASDEPQALSPHRGRRSSCLSVLRFRALARYAGRPAAADLAFSVAALAVGVPEGEVAHALRVDYLSSSSSISSREKYCERTLQKATTRINSHAP